MSAADVSTLPDAPLRTQELREVLAFISSDPSVGDFWQRVLRELIERREREGT